MFRKIRKRNNALSEQECLAILCEQDTAVLSLIGDDGYPYGVPLNYVYRNGHVFLHGAKKGHKIDSIKNNPKACLSIIAKNESVPEKFSTNYQSVILFGQAKILTNKAERYESFMALIGHINGDYMKEGEIYIEEMAKATAAIEFVIEHMSGKANNEDA